MAYAALSLAMTVGCGGDRRTMLATSRHESLVGQGESLVPPHTCGSVSFFSRRTPLSQLTSFL
jgi:hypothetical protein